MAFALTKFTAIGFEAEEPLNKRYIQHAILEITGTSSDVDLDVGDPAGTFWTAVSGTQPGTAALKAMKDIAARAKFCRGVVSPQLYDRIPNAALGSAGQYNLTDDTLGPDILVKASDGESAWYLDVSWYLKDGEEPVSLYATSSVQNPS